MFLLNQISLSHKTYSSILRKKKKKEEKVEGGREGVPKPRKLESTPAK